MWLDKRRTTRFKLGADGKVIAAERDGHPATWVSCDHVETPVDANHRPVFWARPGTSLKVVMLAIHNTDVSPVAIFDENDQLPGLDRRQARAAGGAQAAGLDTSHAVPAPSGPTPRCRAMVWPMSAKLCRRPKLPGVMPRM